MIEDEDDGGFELDQGRTGQDRTEDVQSPVPCNDSKLPSLL